MARQQWRIRVRGKQRKQVRVDLLVAAVMALAEQWQAEQADRGDGNERSSAPAVEPQGSEARS